MKRHFYLLANEFHIKKLFLGYKKLNIKEKKLEYNV